MSGPKPLSALFGRNSIYVFIFLIGFVFNEMLHVALAYHQSKGDFVISSKQIIIRTILYYEYREQFLNKLFNEISNFEKKSKIYIF